MHTLRYYLRAQARLISFALFMGMLVFTSNTTSAACITNQQTCSSGYGVNEAFFGTGGELHVCSTGPTGYCAKQAAGETGTGFTGNTSGGQYQAQAGFDTDRSPSLTFCVFKTACGDNPALNVGTLTAGTTATGTVQFSVKTYLASGYLVTTQGAAPKNSSYTLQTLAIPTTPSSAAEQFGINLVANTSCGGGMPASLGANPVQVPSASFSYGVAAHTSGTDYYDTACKFMYASGGIVASSAKSSGETDFTISYIFNTTALTRGGTYTMTQSLVATSTF